MTVNCYSNAHHSRIEGGLDLFYIHLYIFHILKTFFVNLVMY